MKHSSKKGRQGKTWTKNQPKSSSTAPTDRFYLYSWSAIQEYIRYRPKALLAIECRDNWREKVTQHIAEANLDQNMIRALSEDEVKSESPVRALVRFIAMAEEEFLGSDKPREEKLILALDHITDPRNLGAIARSAAFFGVKAIIAPERRQAPVTEAALNTAQGAFALCDLVQVTNLGRTLERLKEADFWTVGTAMDGEPLADVAGFYDKTVLVLGSEDKGMGQKIAEKCDRIVRIPTPAQFLDSLNVSVAAGICIYEFSSTRKTS